MAQSPQNPLFNTVDDAFHECDNILLWHECPKGKWKPVRAKLPARSASLLRAASRGRCCLVTLGVIDQQVTPLVLGNQDQAEAAGLFEPNKLAVEASAEVNRLAEMRPELAELDVPRASRPSLGSCCNSGTRGGAGSTRASANPD